MEKKKTIKHQSIAQFTKGLQKYNIDDFVNSDEPYHELLNISQDKIGRFNSYSAALMNFIQQKTKDERVTDSVNTRLTVCLEMLLKKDVRNNISSYIKATKNDVGAEGKVSVLPLLCGSGKSTALTIYVLETILRIEGAYYLTQLPPEDLPPELSRKKFEDTTVMTEHIIQLNESEYDGLLIVTDSKERLQRIWNPSPENKYIDEDIKLLIKELEKNWTPKEFEKRWVSIITEENSDEEEKKQRYFPVLCVTTQRYFGWTKKEIKKHLEWEDENGKHRRPLIIFDEQPYLNEIRDISVKTINDIDTALREYLYPDDKVSKEDKQWCCNQWNEFREKFIKLLQHYEYDLSSFDTLYYQPSQHTITEDDKKFFDIIEKNRSKIRAKNNEAYKDLLAVQTFMNTWGVFSHRDANSTGSNKVRGEYWNKFTVYIDNRDKVTNLGAKVIVLDGTGDISPFYFRQDYVDIRDGSNYLRPLSYLTIKLGDLGTSKEDFRKKEIDVSKAVLSYLKEQGYEKKDMVFFTYKGKESKFQARVNGKLIANVAHFGDIRGKNDFTSENYFAQVGLNRMQPVHYLVHVLGRYEDMLNELQELQTKSDYQSMYERINDFYEDDRYIEFMTSHLLADIDQCMFRSAIRNADNLNDVIYYIFYKRSMCPELEIAIENRYHKKLSSQPIKYINEKEILDAMGAGKIAFRLRRWLETWDGELIKQDAIRSELGISRSSFNSALQRDRELAALFKMYNQNAKKMGKRGAWYTKTYSI